MLVLDMSIRIDLLRTGSHSKKEPETEMQSLHNQFFITLIFNFFITLISSKTNLQNKNLNYLTVLEVQGQN